MLKKLFNKRKRQEPKRHNTSKITMDAASIAILTRHFSPLSCRAKSPSDLLDIVGFPHSIVFSPAFINSTPVKEAETEHVEPILTIRNNTTPQEILLLETSREDKTLVEEEKKSTSSMDQQLNKLKQRLIKFEQEREHWKLKLQAYMYREEQLRNIIHKNQERIKQLTADAVWSYPKSSYYTDHYADSAYYTDNSYYTDNTYYKDNSYYTDISTFQQPYYYYHHDR